MFDSDSNGKCIFDFKIPEKVTDMVYSESRMKDPECSPLCVYIPNRQIMFKLIRACIGVHTASELWFMRNKGTVRPRSGGGDGDDEILDDS